LVVVDHPASRRITESLLKRHGLLPRTAATAKEALEILQQAEPFAAIIADCQMSDMDGFAFAERLKNSAGDAKGAAFLLLAAVGMRGMLPVAANLVLPDT
jgi:CheY-like chemotaxis protein